MIAALIALSSAATLSCPQGGALLDAADLQFALESLASAHPDLVSVLPVGRSRAGRRIDALSVGAPDPAPGTPAILVVANLEGPQVWTSRLAFDLARRLAEGYAADERVRALLDEVTVYVVPRADPDAAEARFFAPLAERRASGHAVDTDRDGRVGENGRADIDGDGFITRIRVRDPEGTWIVDPADPRVMIEADRAKGERGAYKLIPEGLDTDGDDKVAEDAAHDAELNANFSFRWPELEPRAGRYPTDEPGALALVEFVIAHPEIALVLTYGEEGNLVRKPGRSESGKRGDESPGLLEEDAELVEEIGSRYRESTGCENEGLEEQPGSFPAWCYHHRGLITLSSLPFGVPAEMPEPEEEDSSDEEAGEEDEESEESADDEPEDTEDDEPEPSEEAKRLAWLEDKGVADAFIPWTAFNHPTLGGVEIGGFRPYALLEPPPDEYQAIADGQLEFFVTLGELLPHVELVELEARELGSGVFEVTGALENDALMPYSSEMARKARSVRPIRVRLILGESARRLSGPPQTLVTDLPGAGGRHELRWLVLTEDPTAISIEIDSDHAGSTTLRPEVK